MSEMRHTPGPWVFDPSRDTHDCAIHQDVPVGEYGYYGPNDGGVVGSSEWLWLKEEDGHLIAAAPDLLEALTNLTAWMKAIGEFKGGAAEALEDAEAAIARAIGKGAK